MILPETLIFYRIQSTEQQFSKDLKDIPVKKWTVYQTTLKKEKLQEI